MSAAESATASSGLRAEEWFDNPLRTALLGDLADVPALPILDLEVQEIAYSWLVPRWIEETGLVLLSGRPKIGKTTLVADVAHAVAGGTTSCLGTPTRRRRVLWIDRDQGPNRCRQLFRRLGATDVDDLLVSSPPGLFSLRDPTGVRQLEAAIYEHRAAGLVVLDSWSMLTPGADENIHTAATRLIEAGVDIRLVKAIMRHASITTTMRYVHGGDLDIAVERLVNYVESEHRQGMGGQVK